MKLFITKFISIFFQIFDTFLEKEYILFSCRGAKDYADNSKYLFEYLLNNSEEVFFYTKKKEVLKSIPKNGVYAYSFKGVITLLKSKILIFTHGTSDFSPFQIKKRPNRILINLFHAIAVKKVGHNDNPLLIQESQLWDYFIVSSDFESAFIQEQYTLPPSKVITIGQSRNDVLNEIVPKNKAKRVVLYAPTFRDDSITKIFPFNGFDILKLNKYLTNNNIEIWIRLHINEENYHKKDIPNLSNIKFVGSDIYPSVNEILPDIDLLITDYSSIYLDYILLDRPIAFIPYDYKEYNKIRGFSFDYFDNLPGPILKNEEDLILFFESPEDLFKSKRIEIKNKFHRFTDFKTCRRLLTFIRELK